MKQKDLIVIASALVLLLAFQNCHNGIQANDIPSASGALGAAGSDGSNTPNSTDEDPASSTDPTTGSTTPAVPDLNPVVPVNPYQPSTPQLALLPVAGEWASIAFEDNVANANGGDRDYNDAVFNFKISEQYNSANQLVRIFMEVRLREKISASNHYLHLILNGNASAHFDNITRNSLAAFSGQANAKITYADGTITNIDSIRDKKLTLFKATTGVVGSVTKLQIDLLSPELNVNSDAQKYVNFLKYRLMLQNRSQDRIGIDIAEINSSDEMLANANGYPFGFMIPTDWAPPAESKLIDEAYPNFFKYREWLNNQAAPISEQALKWYL